MATSSASSEIGEPSLIEATSSTSFREQDGTWMTQFIDDLVAVNHFKTFLVATGKEVPPKVLEGLARLSFHHQWEMDEFVEAEKRRWPLPRLLRLTPRRAIR